MAFRSQESQSEFLGALSRQSHCHYVCLIIITNMKRQRLAWWNFWHWFTQPHHIWLLTKLQDLKHAIVLESSTLLITWKIILYFFLENWSIFVLTICLLEVFISLLAFIYCCLALCWKGFVLEEGFDHGDEEVPQQQFSQELPYTQQHDSPQDQVSLQKPWSFEWTSEYTNIKFPNIEWPRASISDHQANPSNIFMNFPSIDRAGTSKFPS